MAALTTASKEPMTFIICLWKTTSVFTCSEEKKVKKKEKKKMSRKGKEKRERERKRKRGVEK